MLDGRNPSKDEIVNKAIETYFGGILEEYRRTAGPDDLVLKSMEALGTVKDDSSVFKRTVK